MLNFAANLSFLFPQRPFLDRFSAAAEAGFRGCEFLFTYDFEPEDLGAKLSKSELMSAIFNRPPRNLDARNGALQHCPAGKQNLQPQFSALCSMQRY